MLHFKLKGITKCSIMTINILQADTPTSLYDPIGEGVESSKFNFFRTWLRCISNKRLSRMQKHGCKYFACRPPPPPPPTLRMGSIGQKSTFQNMVKLYIKLKGLTNAATCFKYFACRLPPSPTPTPPPTHTLGIGSIGQNSTSIRTWSSCISN